MLFVAALAALFVSGGAGLRALLGEGGLLAAEWLLLFVPALLFVAWGRYDARETLLLRPATLRGTLGGVLLMAGALPVAWTLGWLQGFVLPVPPEMREAMEALVTATSPGRLAWLLVVLAVTPAVCEEVVFRGVLLSSTRTLETWRAVVLNGVVFGAFHLSFEAPVRFLPTAWLGIVMAWAVVRTGSLTTAVLMHFLNNATIVLLASLPATRALATDPTAAPPLAVVASGGAFLVLGYGVLRAVPPGSVGHLGSAPPTRHEGP